MQTSHFYSEFLPRFIASSFCCSAHSIYALDFFSSLHPSCLIFWWALLFSAISGTVAERKGLGFRVWLDMWGVVWTLEETHIAEYVSEQLMMCVCVIDWSSSHCEGFCHKGKRAQRWSPDIYLARYNLERAHRPCKPSPWHVQHLPNGFLFYYFPSLCTITFVLLPCTFLMHKDFYWFSDFVPKEEEGVGMHVACNWGSADEGGQRYLCLWIVVSFWIS